MPKRRMAASNQVFGAGPQRQDLFASIPQASFGAFCSSSSAPPPPPPPQNEIAEMHAILSANVEKCLDRSRSRSRGRPSDSSDSEMDCDEGDWSCSDEEQETKTTEVDAIVDLQRASGAFKWDSILEKGLGLTKAEVEKEADKFGGFENWLTALIVAHFKVRMAASKDLWELVVEKAEKFLKGNNAEKALEPALTFIQEKNKQ